MSDVIEQFNPFFTTESHDSGIFKIVKYLLVGCTLFPIRILSTLAIVPPMLLSAKVASLGLSPNEDAPLSLWRRLVMAPVRLLARVLLFTYGFVWIHRKGTRINDTTKAPIIVSNHVSFLDCLFGYLDYNPCFISKIENLEVPVVSSFLKATRAVLIQRESAASRGAARELITKKARAAFHDNHYAPVFVFPEGTVTNGKCLISFKPGAFNSGLPVQPVTIKYPSITCSLASTWGSSMAKQFLEMLFQVYNQVQLEYLPVYTPTEEEKLNPKIFAENVRQKMAAAMGVPTTQHSFEDVRLMILAEKLHENVKDISNKLVFLELNKLMSFEQATEFLTKFAAFDEDHNGIMDITEFSHMLGVPITPEMEAVFHSFDTNGDGTVDVKEFLVGIAHIANEYNSDELVEHCFKIFDTDKNGTIDQSEFAAIMKARFPTISQEQLDKLFLEIDVNADKQISLDEFKAFANHNPTVVRMALEFKESREKSLKVTQ